MAAAKSYWTWLLFLMGAWLFAMLDLPAEAVLAPWRLAAMALFFALYFVAPLLSKRPVVLLAALLGASAR